MDLTYHVTWTRHRARNVIAAGDLLDCASPSEAIAAVEALRSAGGAAFFRAVGFDPRDRHEIRIAAIERDPLAPDQPATLAQWRIPAKRRARKRLLGTVE